jgi:hypothetical protein
MLKKVLFSIFVLNTLTSVVCFSQSKILDKKISLSIQNKSIISILETIEKKAGFTFSYNNSIFEGGNLTSIHVTNKTIKDILDHLLGSRYQFSPYSNQILISLKPDNSSQKQISTVPKKSSNRQIFDTIHVTVNDTIRKTIVDTQYVKIIDTVIFNDTILISQIKVEESPKSSFFLSAVFSPTVGSVTMYDIHDNAKNIKDLIDNAESNYRGYDAGLQVDFSKNKFRYRTGIFTSTLTKKISYSFDKEYIDDGSVYKDSTQMWQYHTILYYYKFKDGDTVRISVIDSSQVYKSFEHTKRHIEHKKTFGTNTIKMIQIPFSIGYCFSINPQSTISPYFTTRFYLVTMQNGFSYNSLTGNVDSLSSHTISRFFISTALSLQYEYKVNKLTTIFIEPTLNQFINTIFNDKRNVNERLLQCNLAFGLRTLLFNKK